MAHVRDQLADAVETAVTGLATTASNVFRQRSIERTLQPSEMPALRIYKLGDQATSLGITSTPLYERSTQIRIEAVAEATSSLDTVLDAIGAEVETALGAVLTIGASKLILFYRGASFSESAEGQRPTGVLAMQFETTLYTNHGAPEVSLEA